MSIFAGRLGLALVLAALWLGGRTAHAQVAPVSYWIPGWPMGFGGNLPSGQSLDTYGNFPGFDSSDARGGGFSYTRYNFSNGWFVGRESTRPGFGHEWHQPGGCVRQCLFPFITDGVQVGYNFQNSGGLPVKVFAGFDTLKYNTGIGGPFSPFDSTSGTLPVYSAHAGVEFQPAPNLSVSLGVGYTQQPGRISSDINPFLSPVR